MSKPVYHIYDYIKEQYHEYENRIMLCGITRKEVRDSTHMHMKTYLSGRKSSYINYDTHTLCPECIKQVTLHKLMEL